MTARSCLLAYLNGGHFPKTKLQLKENDQNDRFLISESLISHFLRTTLTFMFVTRAIQISGVILNALAPCSSTSVKYNLRVYAFTQNGNNDNQSHLHENNKNNHNNKKNQIQQIWQRNTCICSCSYNYISF